MVSCSRLSKPKAVSYLNGRTSNQYFDDDMKEEENDGKKLGEARKENEINHRIKPITDHFPALHPRHSRCLSPC